MARRFVKCAVKAGDDYALKLSRLTSGYRDIVGKAIYQAADIVTDKVRANLERVTGPLATGDLAESLGITPMDNKGGYYNVKVGFDGYDRKGVPNQLKARVLESGTSKQTKRPFVRPAVRATKAAAEAKMNQVIDEEIEKRMK